VYRLADGVTLWTDVAAFEARAAEGEAALAAGHTDEALDHVAAACTLYRGDLLAGDPYLEWAHRRREDLRLLAVTCWERRCQLLLDRGDLDGAVAAALAVLREEPCHEPVTRRLMVSYARLGQPHRALRHYERIVETLGRVFGAAPAPETETLAACIRRRTPV
jgi:DNA-binding SARP family transcriptional activator